MRQIIRKPKWLIAGVVMLAALLLMVMVIQNGFSAEINPQSLIETSEADLHLNSTSVVANPATQTTQPTLTPEPDAPAMPSSTPTENLPPESFYIRNIAGNRQCYALGCEASAAVDLAAYYNIPIYQFDFQINLPLSDNPNLGFVGDVNSIWGQIPPYAYGVHAAPVADLLNHYGVEVQGGSGYTLEEIKQTLSQSHPVIVWVIGSMEYSEPVVYLDQQGNSAIVAPFEHVVILTGYNADSVRYLNNGKFADVPNEVFLNSWGVLENMVVFHK